MKKSTKIEILTALFMLAVSLVGLYAGDKLLTNLYNL